MTQLFKSPFLGAFEILPWDCFDDGVSGSVFKVVRRAGVPFPVSGIDNTSHPVLIVKVVKLVEGAAEKELREVKLLEKTTEEDENVVRIFGSWEERPPLGFEYPNRHPINQHGARLLFILMEYCDLFSLRRWLVWPQNKRSWAHLVNIFLQITSGLVATHRKEIIHRDLKPSNVGLTCHHPEERVIAKLIDFGLATEFRDVMTSKAGTHLYRAPELHSGGTYDEKVDIYSLGIILCQMMASLTPKGIINLEDQFRRFREEAMSSSLSPAIFDAQTYLAQYHASLEHGVVSKMAKLAQEMTSFDPQTRPSAAEVLERTKTINPETNLPVSMYDYLEELKEKQVWLSYKNCTDTLRPIKTTRLNHLTHLTLKNIRLTKQRLWEIIKECFILKHLSLSLEISDFSSKELLPMPSIRLPHLLTFRFRVHNFDNGCNTTEPDTPVATFGGPRILSLMFFGPVSQIWENRMRVKISNGKQVLVNIDAGPKLLFYLAPITCGYEILEILNKVKFQIVSLSLIWANRHEDLDLNNFWLEENKEAVYELDVWLPNLDITKDRISQGFSCLSDLSVRDLAKLPYKTVRFSVLPPTINRLFLKHIRVCVDGMSATNRRKLESLVLSGCEVPQAFYDKYDRIFQVESLRVSSFVLGSTVSVVPGISYVESVFNTSNWNKIALDPFDWKKTEENCGFREELLSSFFATTDEESLWNKGIILELNEGNAVAKLIEEFQWDGSKGRGNEHLCPTVPVDSDDEEVVLMVQQELEYLLEEFDSGSNNGVALEELDGSLDDNFVFKGTLSSSSDPEGFLESKVIFEKFGGISKDKSNLRRIQLRNCSLSSSLPIQLRGCVNLESLVLDMVEWELDSAMKVSSRLPILKNYTVNLFSDFVYPKLSKPFSKEFSFETFDQLFLFCPGPERIKGLWGEGIKCRVSVQGTLYFQLDETSLTLQFLPHVNKIISLLGLNKNLKTLNIQCCLFKFPESLLLSSITKLSLRYAQVPFRDIYRKGYLECLETLIFEGCGESVFFDLSSNRLPSLKHLTLCNISLDGILTKVEIPLESCTLSRVKLDRWMEVGRSFNETFPSFLPTESLILADDGINSSFNYGTLYSVLKRDDVCMKNVIFIKYERSIVPEASEDELCKYSFCESFLTNNGIVRNSFRVQLEEEIGWKWRADELFPDESEDPLLEGYLETKPDSENIQLDDSLRTENLQCLREREFISHEHFNAR